MNRIDGTAGADRIIGTDDADDIQGGAGRDRINGGKGDDIVNGGDDNDYVYGDEGDDFVYGGLGNDALVGHSGDDHLFGEDGTDGIFGGGGHDTIYGGAGTDTMFGDGGNDLIDGGEGDDKLFGGTGHDTLIYTAGQGTDQLTGNSGIDTARIFMTSADLDASRGDLSNFAAWLDAQLASAGGEEGYAAQASGDSYSFSTLGLTISGVERVELVVDGEAVSLQDSLNQAPVAASEQTLATIEDSAVSGSVGATDPDGDILNSAVSQGPANGAVVMDAATGDFTYTPNGDFAGNDSFTVLVDDGRGGSVEQLVNISVDAVADAPTLAAAVGGVVGEDFSGTGGSDTIVGSQGSDTISGGSGNDVIYADSSAASGITYNLDVEALSNDFDGSEAVSVEVAGVPAGASLSAGTDLGNGSWQLSQVDLQGLTLTLESAQDLTLQVTATASEANGSTQSVSQELLIEAPAQGGNDVVEGGDGRDRIYGGSGNDVIDGGDGNDRLNGGSGDDLIEGGDGKDRIYGGSGNDTATYTGASSGVEVDLDRGSASGGAGRDRLVSIENVIGSDFGDELTGDDGDNVLDGGAGNDTLQGGRGSDTLTGGEGADTFTFDRGDVASRRGHYGVDNITDFDAEDRLDFSDLLKGIKVRDLADVIQLTETGEGTMLSVDFKGYSGFADVVFLEGVFDLDLDFLDGSGQLIV